MPATNILKKIYLFQNFSDSELEKIAKVAIEKEVNAGQEIFMTNESAKSFFVITLGGVKITSTTEKGDAVSIANIASGAHFGEVAFLDRGTRSATAEATEFSRLLEFEFEKLQNVLENDPDMGLKFYQACSRFLATRLRATLSDLSAAKEAKLKLF